MFVQKKSRNNYRQLKNFTYLFRHFGLFVILIILSAIIVLLIYNIELKSWLNVRGQLIFVPIQSFVSKYAIQPTYKSQTYENMLLQYSEQWQSYSNAKFVAEIHDQHLAFRIRFDEFVSSNDKSKQSIGASIICYSKLQNTVLTRIPLVLHISQREVISIEVNGKLITANMSGLVHIRKDIFIFRVPHIVTENTLYGFSLQVSNNQQEKFLDWPVWPLSNECVKEYLTHFGTHEFQQGYRLPCSLTSHLKGVTHQEQFVSERNAVSKWLDIAYNVNDRTINYFNRRKHAFELVSDKSYCSGEFHKWIKDYHSWHTRIARLISDPKLTFVEQRELIFKHDIQFLFMIRFDSGIADRTTHFITCYLIAMVTKRFFVFDDTWPEFAEVMQASLAFRPEIITPWVFHLNKSNENLSTTDPRYLSNVWQITRTERCLTDYDYDKLFPERILFLKSHIGNVMQMLTSEKGVYSNFLGKTLKLRPDNIFGCLYHSLLVPRVSTFVEATSIDYRDEIIPLKNIIQILLLPQHPTIGIQIRTGDSFLQEKTITPTNNDMFVQEYEGFLQCAEQLVDPEIKTVIFLMADSFRIRTFAMQRWYSPSNKYHRIQLLTSTRSVIHITYTNETYAGFRDGILDMFLYSLCDQHVFSLASGFGRLSAFASMKGVPLYHILAKEKPMCGLGEGRVNFSDSGRHWSGI